ncbi:uncharacterized protein EHS24_005647 [Apiotrichum porosum]|uniref:WLM domain-containing protein n=1 Tax=Apiotrichum porosum TaxID=105984 RepID=A0A427XZ25_9TREE|nr:uncharacterized protein EHS24_005647 [Apiotrichum porosum]RSH84144.1 hypothetical protein EHS24_005647 [Apiotrichum porosum]
MQRPGNKINTRDADPNHFITFIRVLDKFRDKDVAESILKAVAAQTKPIFQHRYMQCITLEEAKHNNVWVGLNTNHGQRIQLVLRRPNGSFYPLPFIMSVMCHEMAHITHMNHRKDFQELNAAIKKDVAQLQSKGYYGDGFWSNGKRLGDSVPMGSDGLDRTSLPEHVCGVSAYDDARSGRRVHASSASSRAPGLVKGEASHRSGRQTDYRRKAGRRVNTDMGESSGRLDGRRDITKEDREKRAKWVAQEKKHLMRTGMSDKKAQARAAEMFDDDNPWYKEGSTFGKRAKSKTASDQRAAAFERLLGLNKVKDEVKDEAEDVDYESEEGGDRQHDVNDSEVDELDSSDDDNAEVQIKYEPVDDGEDISMDERRRELEVDDAALRDEWNTFLATTTPLSSGSSSPTKRHPGLGNWNTFIAGLQNNSKRKLDEVELAEAGIFTVEDSPSPPPPQKRATPTAGTSSKATKTTTKATAPKPRPHFGASMVGQERNRNLGLATSSSSTGSSSRVLGSGPSMSRGGGGGGSVSKANAAAAVAPVSRGVSLIDTNAGGGSNMNGGSSKFWTCGRCTYAENHTDRGRCEMCEAHPDGTE